MLLIASASRWAGWCSVITLCHLPWKREGGEDTYRWPSRRDTPSEALRVNRTVLIPVLVRYCPSFVSKNVSFSFSPQGAASSSTLSRVRSVSHRWSIRQWLGRGWMCVCSRWTCWWDKLGEESPVECVSVRFFGVPAWRRLCDWRTGEGGGRMSHGCLSRGAITEDTHLVGWCVNWTSRVHGVSSRWPGNWPQK